jgi:hypothetical protein
LCKIIFMKNHFCLEQKIAVSVEHVYGRFILLKRFHSSAHINIFLQYSCKFHFVFYYLPMVNC